MKQLGFFFFLFPSLLSAYLSTSSISSNSASYDGNALILKGKVELTHALGKLESQSARLEKEDPDRPFSQIHLKDEVLITLKNQGKIRCQSADFDFSKLTGKLLPKQGKTIQFTQIGAYPLSFQSHHADVELSKKQNQIELKKIKAKEHVLIRYGKDFLLQAEKAIYTDTSLTAMPKCILTHLQDKIVAEKVEFFPDTAKMIFHNPQGVISSTTSCDKQVQFSSQQLMWEHIPHLLTLIGEISIADPCLGKLHCDEEIELHQKVEEGKWTISDIVATGKTSLEYALGSNLKHLLLCHGKMHLDKERLVLTLESPADQPIEYFHDQMTLCANQAQIDYSNHPTALHPERLLLSGHVRLSGEENASRCALADQFTFYPDKKKMVLSSNNGSNVLFWDDQQELFISAREVHLTHSNKGESVKGVGNVRFSFTSTENELLKKIFPFYKPRRS